MVFQWVTYFSKVFLSLLFLGACSTVKEGLGIYPSSGQADSRPIRNPFGEQLSLSKNDTPLLLRAKKGDKSVEVQVPTERTTSFIIPLEVASSTASSQSGRSPASEEMVAKDSIDDHYLKANSTVSDREILSTLSQGDGPDLQARSEIEKNLGLTLSDNQAGLDGQVASYLAGIDHIKQLFKAHRFEAALIEIDQMLNTYQTDPQLYKMRGTLFDRLGKKELAIKSWLQAQRLNPHDQGFKKFVDKQNEVLKTPERTVSSAPIAPTANSMIQSLPPVQNEKERAQ